MFLLAGTMRTARPGPTEAQSELQSDSEFGVWSSEFRVGVIQVRVMGRGVVRVRGVTHLPTHPNFDFGKYSPNPPYFLL